MVRYQKIRKVLSVSLSALLFLVGCSMPKQSGIALYTPVSGYGKDVADTAAAEVQADFIDLSEALDVAAQLADTAFLLINTDTSGVTVEKPDTAVWAVGVNEAYADVNTVENLRSPRADSLLYEEKEIGSVFEKADTLAKTIIVETDTIYKTIEIEKTEEISSSGHAGTVAYLQNPTDGVYHRDIGKEMLPAARSQAGSLSVYDDPPMDYQNAYPDNVVSDSQRGAVLPQLNRVQIQSGKHYLAAAAETQRNYRPSSSFSPRNQTTVAPNSRELVQLRARAGELERQNKQLQNALYGIQSTIVGHPASSGYSPQSSSELIIAAISDKLEEITDLMAADTLKQRDGRDEIVGAGMFTNAEPPLDTVLNAVLLENTKLTAAIAGLQDSIELLQSYISLKNEAPHFLERKTSVGREADSIFFTAYYNAGKIISTKEKSILSAIRQKITDKKVRKISLLGFTDSSGTPQLNLRLSNQRTARWMEQLVKTGISRELIFLQYFGAEYASEKVIRAERRVEIIVEVEK